MECGPVKQREMYHLIAELLNTIDIAVCIFDDQDRTVVWNSTFFTFFPEHDGNLFAGEHYRDNLRRFYRSRLVGEECQNIERYIDEGVERHRRQARPFVFSHRGRLLRVASLPLPNGDRIRIWQNLKPAPHASAEPSDWTDFPIDLLEYLADGAMILDRDDKIIAANSEFRALYDIESGTSAVGATLHELVREAWVKAGLPSRAAELSTLDSVRFAGAPFEVELPGGRWRRVIARRTPSGIGYFTHSDITLLKRAMSNLSAMASTDGLTGLANRRRFDEACSEEWRRHQRDGTAISLMLIDIDNFKQVNDQHGHIVGDECLCRVARIVQSALLRSADLAARHGGEEFAVLLPDTGFEHALQTAQRIRDGMANEAWTAIHPKLSRITVSIGICSGAPAPGVDVTDYVRRADIALYRAKKLGRDRIEDGTLADLPPPPAFG